MGRYALLWEQRNEIGESERRVVEVTAAEARALIESKDDWAVAVGKLMVEKLEEGARDE